MTKSESYEVKAAKYFLKDVYEESMKKPEVDVYELQEGMKPRMHMNQKAIDIFFDLLEEQTHTNPITGNTEFYDDAVIE